MAWHETYSKSITNLRGRTITYEIQEDLASAPGSVESLPLLRKDTNFEMKVKSNNELSEGVQVRTFNASFMDIGTGGIQEYLFSKVYIDVRLVIYVGTDILFEGFPDLKRNKKYIDKNISVFNVLFRSPESIMIDQVYRPIKTEIANSTNPYHKWDPEISSDQIVPFGDLISKFFFEKLRREDTPLGAITNTTSYIYNGSTWEDHDILRTSIVNPNCWDDDTKIIDVVKDICRLFSITIGWSYNFNGFIAMSNVLGNTSVDYKTFDKLTMNSTGLMSQAYAIFPFEIVNRVELLKKINSRKKENYLSDLNEFYTVTASYRDVGNYPDGKYISLGELNTSSGADTLEGIKKKVPFDSQAKPSLYRHGLKVTNGTDEVQNGRYQDPVFGSSAANGVSIGLLMSNVYAERFFQKNKLITGVFNGILDAIKPFKFYEETTDTTGKIYLASEVIIDFYREVSEFKASEIGTYG